MSCVAEVKKSNTMSQNQLLPLASPVTNRHFQRYVCMYITYVPFTSSVFWIPLTKIKLFLIWTSPSKMSSEETGEIFSSLKCPPGRFCQNHCSLMIKNFFLTSSLNLLSPTFKLPLLVLPLQAIIKNLSPSSFTYQRPQQYLPLNFPFFRLKENMKGLKAGFWYGHISSKCALKVAHVKS